MKTIVAVSTMLCFSGSAIDSNYDVVSSDFVDAGLPEIAQEIWRGHGVVRRHVFFLQMHAKYLFGPVTEQLSGQGPTALAILAGILVAALWIKASYPSIWWYKDTEGVVRGPFSTLCMRHWRSKGYLPDDLEIKYTMNASFAPLRELFPAPAVPFQSPPTPQGTRPKPVPVKDDVAEEIEHGKLFEQEVSDDMLRAQHEAFENRSQDLEDEMMKALEAELEESVQSDGLGPKAISKEKDMKLWDSLEKPQVVDEEGFAEMRVWHAKRSLRRKEMVRTQIQTSWCNADKILHRRSSKDKENSMKRNSSEERIQKQLNTWISNEMTSAHEAELEENLWSLIESC
jgi:hypothetical protein